MAVCAGWEDRGCLRCGGVQFAGAGAEVAAIG